MTSRDAAAVYRAVRARFRDAGLSTADLDARILCADALGMAPEALVLLGEKVLCDEVLTLIEERAERRLAGEPVGRILGRRDFWDMTLRLGPETLEPRPDTEILVEAALDALRARGAGNRPVRFVDIGTGTGAIAIALLREVPTASALAVDISLSALRIAAVNALEAGVADRMVLARADYGAALMPARFDLVVSNPPYIASGELADLSREVCEHDPIRALDGGEDGLEAYRTLVPQAFRALVEEGRLCVEIGASQRAAVGEILRISGFSGIAVRHDLGGCDRVVSGLRSPKSQ